MSDAKQKLIVIGNGMVGHRFCEQLSEIDTGRRFAVTVLGEERWAAYDRVHLTSYFETRTVDGLMLTSADWYASAGIELRLQEGAKAIDPVRKTVTTTAEHVLSYDVLVLATGSAAFVPPLEGVQGRGVFVYRTIEDLDAIQEAAQRCSTAAVLGGGLLGLEAAKAAVDMGLTTHVVEYAPRLMPRQLDTAGATLLQRSIESLGVSVHVDARTRRVVHGANGVQALEFADDTRLPIDMLIISAGIRPRDELARAAGIQVGPRGGIIVDEGLRTSLPDVYAIGECALHSGMVYGLVGPGYEMAQVLASRLLGREASFVGADMSSKLKLMGVDVASFGDPLTEAPTRTVTFEDLVSGVYKKLVLSEDCSTLLGGVLVGDTSDYMTLVGYTRSHTPVPERPEALILGERSAETDTSTLAADAMVCSCNNVRKGAICQAVQDGCASVGDLKAATRVGTGCGGCLPLVTTLLQAEMAAAGKQMDNSLCEHFSHSRQELYHIAKVKRLASFAQLLAEAGQGSGCEVCKPAVASILASLHNEPAIAHQSLQDTNDKFLANIQRGGTYSVVPRVAGGEITADKLIVLGTVAQKYGLYTKITGGQRIDLFGARVDQLPAIWEELIAAGFESGHAYGKALRTVKSCVGSTWCRYGVQDSVAFAIQVENRYKGLRAPHKIKGGVSGCVRECAEAQSKDFGLIATEKGYNLYVCGNGGAKPRHAELLAEDVDEATAVRYLDRFLMYYIETADKLTRTATWLDQLENGIEQLRAVVIEDSLGLCEEFEASMQRLVGAYRCEWTEVVERPELRERFRHFAGANEPDPNLSFVAARGQQQPAPWPTTPALPQRRHLNVVKNEWVPVAAVESVPADGGITVRYGAAQLAVYNFASRGEWYATQAMCPHKGDVVLPRGTLGDSAGTPKVACPQHKKCFSLQSGECLSDEGLALQTFPVKVENGQVWLSLPPVADVEAALKKSGPALQQSAAVLSGPMSPVR